MAQECGLLGHRSCVEQEQGRKGKMEEAAAGRLDRCHQGQTKGLCFLQKTMGPGSP